MQCAVVCCGVMQRNTRVSLGNAALSSVSVCCSVRQCVAVCRSKTLAQVSKMPHFGLFRCVTVCGSVSRCVAVCCSETFAQVSTVAC